MDEAGNIEVFTLLFTAGVAAGAVLPWMVPEMSVEAFSPALLLLLGLPFVFRERLVKEEMGKLLPLLLLSFFTLGIFCSLTASFGTIQVKSAAEGLASLAVEKFRAHIDALPFRHEETAPLLKAFLTGDKSGLTGESVGVFRRSGASHLLALSGLHMGIIYLIFDRLSLAMGRSPLSRVLRYFAIVLLSGFFTLMTGASPSIVRAFLFILIGETLRLSGRERKLSRVLCLALFAQLVISPTAIRSVGFQLSYLAMAGITLLYPIMEKWYPEGIKYDPIRWIWKTAAMTISCQVFTAPLAWHYFHTFPKHFLLTNLLALPLTGILMGTAILTLAWSALAPCPDMLIRATDLLAGSLFRTLEIISGM